MNFKRSQSFSHNCFAVLIGTLVLFAAAALSCSKDRDNPLDPTVPNSDRFIIRATLTSKGLRLDWTPVGNSAIGGYRIYHSHDDAETWSILDSVPVGVTTFTDTSMTESGEFSYKVTAFGSDGRNSAPSAVYVHSLRLRQWQQLYAPPNGRVRASIQFRGELILAGEFTSVSGMNANSIASWNGQAWNSVGTGLDGPATSLAVFEERLIVAGNFNSAGGTAVKSIAAWNGTFWQRLGDSYFDNVTAMTVFGERLIVAATESFAGSSVGVVYSWNGAEWRLLGAFHGTVESLASFDDYLVAAGNIDSVAQRSNWLRIGNFDFSIKYLAVWDQLADTWDRFPVDFPGYYYRKMFVWRDQLLILGFMDGYRMVSWNGSSWRGIADSISSPTTSFRNAIEYNGEIAIGMGYNMGINSTILATWNGSEWTRLAVGNEDNIVEDLWTFNGTLYIKGGFVIQNGKGAFDYASWFDFER